MNKIKPLVCVLSPRDIAIVKEGHNTFKHIPHLWLKYWKAIQSYTILKDFFTNHKEFTHLVIAPDDLVVQYQHYNAIVETLYKEDYPVLSGVCNVDMAHPNTLAICIDELPHIIRRYRKHKWADIGKVPEGIIRVKFAGMPFMFIRRDIVEQVPMKGDTMYDPMRKDIEPRSFDAAFCWECSQRNIPIHVDTRVKMLHLRNTRLGEPYGTQVENIRVGKIPPHVYYQTENTEEDLTEYYFRMICEQDPYGLKLYLKRKPIV